MIPRILFPVCSILLVALFQSGLAFVMIQTKIQISKMSMGIQSGDTDGLIDFFQDWIAKESLETLLPRASLKLVLEELMSDRELWRRSEGNFNDFVTDFETKLRIEKRPLQTILGNSIDGIVLTILCLAYINFRRGYHKGYFKGCRKGRHVRSTDS